MSRYILKKKKRERKKEGREERQEEKKNMFLDFVVVWFCLIFVFLVLKNF